jgi:hypothetical protein
MNDNFITFQVSAELYCGFQYKIPFDIVKKMSNEEIIKEIKIHMKNFFSKPHDLYILKNGIDKLNLHIHDKIEEGSNIIYLCDHCHN